MSEDEFARLADAVRRGMVMGYLVGSAMAIVAAVVVVAGLAWWLL